MTEGAAPVPAGTAVTTKLVMPNAPVGAVKLTDAEPSPGLLATTLVGAAGTASVTVASVNCSRSMLRSVSVPSVPVVSVTVSAGSLPSAAGTEVTV